jgi:DNA polymerase II
VAEEMGYMVVHMYVDCLFVQEPGCRKAADFTPLLEAIAAQTGIPIALDGVYRWVAFLPSKRDRRIPVPNRYFGVFQDGEIKYRGIELRRHDTPPWVAKTQLAVLQCLAQAETLEQVQHYIPRALEIVERANRDLKAGRVPVEDLLVTQRLSRELDNYKTPSPAARAAMQLVDAGKTVAPGQVIRFVFTRGRPGVWAYGCGKFDQGTLGLKQYGELLERAARTILDSFMLVPWRQKDRGKEVLQLITPSVFKGYFS